MNKKDSKKKNNNGAGIISVIVFIVFVVRAFGIDELKRVFSMLGQGLADDGNLAGMIAVIVSCHHNLMYKCFLLVITLNEISLGLYFPK